MACFWIRALLFPLLCPTILPVEGATLSSEEATDPTGHVPRDLCSRYDELISSYEHIFAQMDTACAFNEYQRRHGQDCTRNQGPAEAEL